MQKATKLGQSTETITPKNDFPKNFLWGVATAAHQIEGGQRNQWTEWETHNAATLAAQAEYMYGELENWANIAEQAKNPKNYISGAAVEHYERYLEDFRLAKKMGLNAWRFSVEWSRIEPQEGAWSTEAIDHYKKYAATLKKAGLEPVVTLFHFTLPIWFAEKGGFTKRKNIEYFVRFCERIVAELGITIKYVITINEPEVYAAESYLKGNWPPQLESKRAMVGVLQNLATAHNQVAKKIHAMNRRYKLSIAKNSSYIYAGDDSSISMRSAAVAQYFQDDYFLKKVVKSCDFLGVNYYFSDRFYGTRVHNPHRKTSDLGWDLSPENLEFALERLYKKYHMPIMITENGLADADDRHRIWWLEQTMIAMKKARQNGVELIGYLHWSMLDNFEWNKGFWPQFGLFYVDRATMKRMPRKSALWFMKFIKGL